MAYVSGIMKEVQLTLQTKQEFTVPFGSHVLAIGENPLGPTLLYIRGAEPVDQHVKFGIFRNDDPIPSGATYVGSRYVGRAVNDTLHLFITSISGSYPIDPSGISR